MKLFLFVLIYYIYTKEYFKVYDNPSSFKVCVYCMFVAIMAFFAKISDSSVGGTYMTLLNTVANFGANWPAMLALYFVDPLTWKKCEGGVESFDNACRDTVEKEVSTISLLLF